MIPVATATTEEHRDLAQLAREGGFTLIEMLMAIVISGIILGPIAATLLVGLRTSDETSNRLVGSNDAQMLSVWLTPDVQSAGGQSGDVATSSNTDCSGISNVLRLRWRETSGTTTTTYHAAYAISQSSGEWRLIRYLCVNSGSATTHVVARNLASSTAASASANGTKVTVTVTEKSTPANPTGYTFTVSAHRRTQ